MSRDPQALPDRWLYCPKIGSPVEGIFVPFKTPLDESFVRNVPTEQRWEPKDVFTVSRNCRLELGAIVDLTNSKRYYKPSHFLKNGIEVKKLACRGHGETPDKNAINEFVRFCANFRAKKPQKKIGVHCTHGFNRTGFLICAYLVEHEHWDVMAAIKVFSCARKPGIYKQDYINMLFKLYGDPESLNDAPAAPQRPLWDEKSESSVKSASKAFMEGIPGVSFVDNPEIASCVRQQAASLCAYHYSDFPGSQPVSLCKANLEQLSTEDYKVSWKADGTRYMMLVAGPKQIFFLDRDNAVFQVTGLSFPYRKDLDEHLFKTLLDGEMVLDQHGDSKIPRYLIYDIVHFRDDAVGQMNFNIRTLCIQKEIIETRRHAAAKGLLTLADEPFSLRKKEFYDIDMTEKILADKFQSQVSHEIDGVIFQPVNRPYQSGRSDHILKWKPPHLNSIDFLLRIQKTDTDEGGNPQTRGCLFVNHYDKPLCYLEELTPQARALNGRIVECKIANTGWAIMRERTDKSFPNSYQTALGVWNSIRKPITECDLLKFIRERRVKKRPADNENFAVPETPKRKRV